MKSRKSNCFSFPSRAKQPKPWPIANTRLDSKKEKRADGKRLSRREREREREVSQVKLVQWEREKERKGERSRQTWPGRGKEIESAQRKTEQFQSQVEWIICAQLHLSSLEGRGKRERERERGKWRREKIYQPRNCLWKIDATRETRSLLGRKSP